MVILSTFVRAVVLYRGEGEGEISAKGWFIFKISQFQDFFFFVIHKLHNTGSIRKRELLFESRYSMS